MAGCVTLLMGCILEHLPGPYPRKKNKSWKLEKPCVTRWLTSRGHIDERVYRHLPERVKRKFDFIQYIPRHPSDIPEMPKEMMATVLMPKEVLKSMGASAWLHGEGSPPKPANREQLIE
uniref:Uncharacterized protein n=1 Tax=Medicago truncatula TaxID=3880 RepID=Q2HUW3_MEDTR|nr:hypothetical protein MtrDRAFT_AC149040g30v2 [Medicago truncatula]